MKPIRSLAFVVNAAKPGASELADDLVGLARSEGTSVTRTDAYPLGAGFLKGADACCVIGGDGTLLGIVPEAARQGVPVIGVNRGSLGFLTTFGAEEARARLPRLLAGDYQVSRRSLLSCTTGDGDEDLALNDVLVKDEVTSRIVRLEVFAGDELVTEYHCDGLIFCTPTGSTAYNLSAGGPLLHPGAEALAMTPICPHTLSNRSILFPPETRLRVFNRTEAHVPLRVAIDGQRTLRVCGPGQPIGITVSPLSLQLVQEVGHSHFSVVRTKLKWSGGSASRPASS